MTCIVGLKNGDEVLIGGDSAAATSQFIMQVGHPKVFRNEGFVMGYTTSFRMGQVLEHVFQPPSVDATEYKSMMQYMVKAFVPELIRTFRDTGFGQQDKGGAETGGDFIVGYEDNLFEVNSDYQVQDASSGYAATGSGYLPAYGSLYTTTNHIRLVVVLVLHC